jgi:hypothetical protein
MTTDVNELEAFTQFAREKLKGSSSLSLEDCLRQWRSNRDATRNGGAVETPYAKAQRLGLIGCIKEGPKDLSTNPKYMEGFGKS